MELQLFYDSLKAVSVLENTFEMWGYSLLMTALFTLMFFIIVLPALYGAVILCKCFINKSLINIKIITETDDMLFRKNTIRSYFWCLFIIIPILSIFIYSTYITIKQYSYITYDDVLKSPLYSSLNLAEKDFINYQLVNTVKKRFTQSEQMNKVSLYEINEIIENTTNIDSLLPKYKKMIELETLLNNKNKG